MSSCPNVSSREWKNLVKAVGGFEALRDFMESGDIRNPGVVQAKLDQREKDKLDSLNQTTPSEPGVSDEFPVVTLESSAMNQKLPLESQQEMLREARGNEIINKLVDRLKGQTGIQATFITEADAAYIVQNAGAAYDGEASFFNNGQVYLVIGKVTPEKVLHEFAHAIVRAVAAENPTLFVSLYNELASTAEGQEIIQDIRNLYPTMEFKDKLQFMEEAIVTAIGRKSANKITQARETDLFSKLVNKILYAIKQLLRKIYKGNKITVENLDVTTTLDQLAEMLASKDFQIKTELVTQADIVSFSRDYREEMINDLASVEQKELNMISKRMYNLVRTQSGFLNTKNYKEIAKALRDKMERADLTEIIGNLRLFQTEGERIFSSPEEEEKYMAAHAEALLNSMLRFNQASKRILEYFKDINKNINNKEALLRGYYLNRVIKDWSKFINYAKDQLALNDNFKAGHPLFNLINEMKDNLDQSAKYSDKIYSAGVGEMLVEQLTPLMSNIDAHYERIIKRYEDRGADKKIIDYYKREWDLVKLTPERIEGLLKGELGDAHALNSYLEGYMHNQDPIVLGFAGYVKDRFMEMSAMIQRNYNAFINDIEGLVKDAGYNTAFKRMHMGKDMLYLDVLERDENGNPTKSVWKFISPYQGYEGEQKKLEKDLDDAKAELNQTNSDEAKLKYVNAMAALEAFKADFMYRPYTDAYYSLHNLFLDDVGKEAYLRMHNILAKIRGLNSNVTTPDEILENLEDAKIYWREYRQLKSMYYADGSPKKEGTMDYDVAVRLKEYSNKSSKFHQYVQRKGAFQNAYLAYIQTLKDNKITGAEYDQKREAWLKNNVVTKLNADFYKERARIFSELAKLAGDDPTQKRIIEVYGMINNMISSYRDNNSHPIGSEMPEALLEKIKSLEDELEDLRAKTETKKTGRLTRQEWDFYNAYKSKLKAYAEGTGDAPSSDDTVIYSELRNKLKKEGAISDEELGDIEARKLLFQELNDLQQRVVSQDYIDTVNEFISNSPEALEYIKKELKQSAFSPSDIEMMSYPQHLSALMAKSPEFAAWFNTNHMTRTYFDSTGTEVTKYVPTRAWTYIKPNSSKYYETTDILNPDGSFTDEQFELYKSYKEKEKNKQIITAEESAAYSAVVKEVIEGVPTLAYFYREIKDSYTDENGNEVKLKTERVSMLDAIRAGRPIEEATIDSRGRWLPRQNAKDQRFMNPKYADMRSASPKKFALLQKLIEKHLEIQEELPYNSKLDLEAPRYRKTQYETLSSRTLDENVKMNPISVWARNIRAAWTKAPEDVDEGYNPEDNLVAINADLYDDEFAKIPITGMFNLPEDEVSMDLLTGMMRYMQSGVRQKTLLDMLPMARALQKLVQTPPNKLKEDIGATAKNMGYISRVVSSITSPVTGKGRNIRAMAINSFIEKEFEGKNNAGFVSDNVAAQKFVNNLLSLSSKTFFSFNIPAAIKNSFGARFQSMIEAAAGNNFNWADYGRGTVWANMVTMEISMQVYKFGKKSMNYQLVELMDPSQGRLQSQIREGAGISKSAVSDTVDLSIMTNVRKWTELNATLSIFGAMLTKEQVEITDANGKVSKITYDKAWEVKDGVIQLKDGIDKTYAPGGAKYKAFVKKVHGVTMALNGAYDSFNQPMANRFLLYRMVMFLKKYFTEMFMNRFQATVKGGRIVPRYDGNMDTVAMGYYVEFFKAVKNMFTLYKFNLRNMTEGEIMASKKTLAEIGLLVILSQLLIGLLFGWDPDDEDRYEKLRQKSGALPFLGVADDPDHPFRAQGWFENHLLNLAIQVEAENDSWLPYPGMGLDAYADMFKLESIAMTATVDRWVDLIGQATNYVDYLVTGDQKALYKREVGPYDWQQQGSAKFLNHLMKTLTFTGTSVEPIQGIKGLESRENR